METLRSPLPSKSQIDEISGGAWDRSPGNPSPQCEPAGGCDGERNEADELRVFPKMPQPGGCRLGGETERDIKPRGIGRWQASSIPAGEASAPTGGNFSSAFIKVEYDGSVDLMRAGLRCGTGSDTVLAQIAAEELGVRLEDVRIHAGDTAITPSTQGVWGSRETLVAGNAVCFFFGRPRSNSWSTASSFSGRGKGRTGIVGGKDLLEEEPPAAVWALEPRPHSKPMFGRGRSVFPHGGSDRRQAPPIHRSRQASCRIRQRDMGISARPGVFGTPRWQRSRSIRRRVT